VEATIEEQTFPLEWVIMFNNSFKVSYRNLNFYDNKSRFYDRIQKGRARKVEGEASKLVPFFKVGV
jgi:hypothetical protein